MFEFMDGVFGHSEAVAAVEPRVYELTGHAGALGIVGIVLGVMLWAAVMTSLVLVVIELVRRQRRPRAGQAMSDALRMLDERYALGEIEHDEYAQRKMSLLGT